MTAARANRSIRWPLATIAAALACGAGLSAQQSPSPPAVQPAATVTVLEETPLVVRTLEPISSTQSRDGAHLVFSIDEEVRVGGRLAIPRGARVRGEVVKSKRSGALTGSPELVLKLTALELEGRTYPLDSYQFKMTGVSKTPATEKKIATGATIGAIVGSTFAGTSAKSGVIDPANNAANSAAVAALGAGVGTAIAAASPGPAVRIPAEAQIEFSLASPVTLPEARPETIKKLTMAAQPGDPVLYVRGERP